MSKKNIFKIPAPRSLSETARLIARIRIDLNPSFLFLDKEKKVIYDNGSVRFNFKRFIVFGFAKENMNKDLTIKIRTFFSGAKAVIEGNVSSPSPLPSLNNPGELIVFHFPTGYNKEVSLKWMTEFKETYHPFLIYLEDTTTKIVAIFKKGDISQKDIDKLKALTEFNLTPTYKVFLTSDAISV